MITEDQAANLAKLPLACLRREYPNSISHALFDEHDVRSPRQLHPAFYGCLDWHSAVHGHWLLARTLRRYPAIACAAEIRALFDETLTADNIAIEIAYFDRRPSFERTYGWAWLLELARELRDLPWADAVQPLADAIAARYVAFLPRQTYPIRTGVHANTAFGIALALDYARATGHRALAELLVERALTYYAADTNAPIAWEPGGEDFFSPALIEADLMRRVLPAPEYAHWLHAFLPVMPLAAAIVDDRSDPKLAHLDGLNLSRAWCLRALAAALPAGDPLAASLAAAGDAHAAAGLAHVATGDYMGEHWLASFAMYLLG